MDKSKFNDLRARLVDALERYGPLCTSQIYTILETPPASTRVALDQLLSAGLVEVREESYEVDGPEELVVYGLRSKPDESKAQC